MDVVKCSTMPLLVTTQRLWFLLHVFYFHPLYNVTPFLVIKVAILIFSFPFFFLEVFMMIKPDVTLTSV